jgi:hypothetical protein
MVRLVEQHYFREDEKHNHKCKATKSGLALRVTHYPQGTSIDILSTLFSKYGNLELYGDLEAGIMYGTLIQVLTK